MIYQPNQYFSYCLRLPTTSFPRCQLDKGVDLMLHILLQQRTFALCADRLRILTEIKKALFTVNQSNFKDYIKLNNFEK